MNIADQRQLEANETVKAKPFNLVKLVDLISRIVPSAFFLLVVLLRFVDLLALIKNHSPGNGPDSWKFLSDVAARSSTVCFLALMSILFLIKLEPIRKSKGILPRVMAIAGTFFVALVTFFPRANLSMTQIMMASSISLVGTVLSIVALAHLGRAFSLMAEARRLVTSGPYSVVRHPLYLFEAVASLGVVLQFLSLYTSFIFLAYAFLQFQRMKNEEAVLGKAFPEYQTYKLKTARLIPGLY